MVLNIDLNDLPAESWQFEDDAAPIDLQDEQITIIGSPGSFSSPIDADAIDDEVMLLPSSEWFSPAKRLPRRKRPVTVVIDESLETNSWESGVEEEPATTLSLSFKKMRRQVPIGTVIIDCDLNANENYIPKENKRMKPNPAVRKEVSAPAEEPALKCPVCLALSTELSSTVCGHVFCCGCIETAVAKQKKCPTCRRKLTKRNYHRLYLP